VSHIPHVSREQGCAGEEEQSKGLALKSIALYIYAMMNAHVSDEVVGKSP
jgi:hypothetical protein